VDPSSPNLPLNLALGALAGLALGLGLAFLREQLDPGMRGRHQVERETGLSVLSMVPLVDRPGPVLEFSAADYPAAGNGAVVRTGSGGTRRLRRAAEKAISLEAYRSLAVDLNFAPRSANGEGSERGFHSLAVTSATRGEGKTLTACNLALVHAAAGHRTLLVDTDVRAAGVARFFGFGSTDPGLSDVLGDRRYDVRSVRREVRIDGGESLTLLLAGAPVRNSASLFEGALFERMFQDFEREYDLVVFDTPPLSLITDAAAIVASVEGVLVVVRSGVTERETLEYTLQRIRRVNGNVLGVVLNGVPSRQSYGHHYEYYRDEVKRGTGS
jgi:capsular exopolysaccharide synthesis family protein